MSNKFLLGGIEIMLLVGTAIMARAPQACGSNQWTVIVFGFLAGVVALAWFFVD